jgi:hypothetical protein
MGAGTVIFIASSLVVVLIITGVVALVRILRKEEGIILVSGGHGR